MVKGSAGKTSSKSATQIDSNLDPLIPKDKNESDNNEVQKKREKDD